MSSTAKNPVKAARTTMEIVEALKEREGAGVTELADHLDMSKSSVHNYLSTLQEDEYVVKDGSEYRVGLRFLDLGVHARCRRTIVDDVRREVDALAEDTGELVNFMVEEHGYGVYVYRNYGDQAVKVDARTGDRVHLHNTALGKAILAHFPEERVEAILDRHGLPQTTEHTVTDREALFEELDEVRERSIAFDREERLEGLRCVAAPVLRDGEVVEGAVSVSGPRSRLQGERFETTVPEKLRDTVNVIDLNVTYS